MRLVIQIGAMRKVCTNGLMVGENFKEMSKKHYASLNVDGMVEEINRTLPVFEKTMGVWKLWRDEKVTIDDAIDILEPIHAAKKEKVMIVDRFSDHEEKNKWGLFQAATWVTSHDIVSKKNPDNSRIHQVALETELAEKVFYRGMNN
jgi:hypothetical protein